LIAFVDLITIMCKHRNGPTSSCVGTLPNSVVWKLCGWNLLMSGDPTRSSLTS